MEPPELSMPLSEHEQRILDEIERRLAAEDPKFARSTTVKTPRGVAKRRIKRSFAGFVVGLSFLIAGLVTGLGSPSLLIAFGAIGFGIMLTSVLFIVRATKDFGPPSFRSRERTSWFDRMEERWKRRFDGDNGGS